MANGYLGKILWVDLTTGNIAQEPLDEKLCRDYLGGHGLGARILFSRQKAGVNALGPDNTLGFVTGLFSGTPALGGSRYSVVGKSPLTGTWGDATSGGNFGPHLRFAGYDAVFVTGIAARPVYLLIENGKAEIRDAAPLWGKDTYETDEMLKNELGKDAEVACIGPSGEKVSLIASILTDKCRAAARSGLGAVMGSKKLKAIAVKGSAQVPMYDAAKAAELRKRWIAQLGGQIGNFKKYGTPAVTVPFARMGDSPVKNWSGAAATDFPNVERIGADAVVALQEKKYGCYRCPIACGGHMKQGTGDYKYIEGVHKPEYETIAMFGTNCLNDNLESIIKANDICNRFGMDTISAGACISFAMECFEKGLITAQDTGGIEMTWGNHRSIVAMLEKMGRREGFGAVLADGVKVAAEKIGRGADKYAVHVQGQEPAAHDPRHEYGYASAYTMDATPGRHIRWHAVLSPPGVPYPEHDPAAWTGRGEAQKTGMMFNHVLDAIGACVFVVSTYPDVSVLVDFVNALTGWNTNLEMLLKTGERIANMRQAFNIREGLNPLAFHVADRLRGKPPLEHGPSAGKTVDGEAIAREFLDAMGWDRKTAKPGRAKLLELGMEDVARVLWK